MSPTFSRLGFLVAFLFGVTDCSQLIRSISRMEGARIRRSISLNQLKNTIMSSLLTDIRPRFGEDVLTEISIRKEIASEYVNKLVPMSKHGKSGGSTAHLGDATPVADYVLNLYSFQGVNHRIPLFFDISNDVSTILESYQSELDTTTGPLISESDDISSFTIHQFALTRPPLNSATASILWSDSVFTTPKNPCPGVDGAVGIFGASPESEFARQFPYFGLIGLADTNVLYLGKILANHWCKGRLFEIVPMPRYSDEWSVFGSVLVSGIPTGYVNGKILITTGPTIGLDRYSFNMFQARVVEVCEGFSELGSTHASAEEPSESNRGSFLIDPRLCDTGGSLIRHQLPTISFLIGRSKFTIGADDYLQASAHGCYMKVSQTDIPEIGAPFLSRHIVQLSKAEFTVGICESGLTTEDA